MLIRLMTLTSNIPSDRDISSSVGQISWQLHMCIDHIYGKTWLEFRCNQYMLIRLMTLTIDISSDHDISGSFGSIILQLNMCIEHI